MVERTSMKKWMLGLCCLLCAYGAAAQVPAMHKWQARLDLYHQDWESDIVIGQLGVYDRVYLRPGFRVGIERTWVEGRRFRLYQDLLIGYYHNTYDERSYTFGTDLGVEWRLFREFRLGMPFGLHYNNAKAIDVRYEYDGEKWVRAKNTDPSIARLQIPLGLNLGWRFWPQQAHPVDLFLNSNFSLVGPYQPGSNIPVLLYTAVGVGLRVGL
jgi:hypothetical protein